MSDCQNDPDQRWTAELDLHCKKFDDARLQYNRAVKARDVEMAEAALARMQKATKLIDDLLARSGDDVDDLMM